MAQIGRKTKRGPQVFADYDYYADDVRRVLKRRNAPVEWTDEDALFLLQLVIDPKIEALYRADGAPPLEVPVIESLVRLRDSSNNNIWRILEGIRNAVAQCKTRKGYSSKSWQIIMNQARDHARVKDTFFKSTMRREEQAVVKEYQEACKQADAIWETKAEALAQYYTIHLKDKITAKDVENARSLIRHIRPFKGIPFTPEEEDSLRQLVDTTQSCVNALKEVLSHRVPENKAPNQDRNSLEALLARAIVLDRFLEAYDQWRHRGNINSRPDTVFKMLAKKDPTITSDISAILGRLPRPTTGGGGK